MLGAIIGGVASVASAVLGSKSKSTTTNNPAYNFTKLRNRAVKAGFNPLTALRAQGGTSGGTTTTTGGLSSGAVLAEAVNAGVNTYFNHQQNKMDEQAEGLKIAMMEEELELLQKQNKLPNGGFGYSIPQVTGPGPTHTGTASVKSQPKLATSSPTPPKTAQVYEAEPMTPALRYPDMRAPGGTIETARGWQVKTDRMTAEDSEKEYGDWAFVTGARNAIEDWGANFKRANPWIFSSLSQKGPIGPAIKKKKYGKENGPRKKAKAGWMEEKYGKGHY